MTTYQDDAQLTLGEAAAYLTEIGARRVRPRTLQGYVRRGLGPVPDGRIGPRRVMWWHPATLRRWQEGRPGSGNWTCGDDRTSGSRRLKRG
jgi:hypothetical protein